MFLIAAYPYGTPESTVHRSPYESHVHDDVVRTEDADRAVSTTIEQHYAIPD